MRVDTQHDLLLSFRALMEYMIGDFTQGEALLGRLATVLHAAPPEPDWEHVIAPQTIAIVAHMTGATDHFDVAQSAAETVLSSQRVSPQFTWLARTCMALMAVQQGDIGIVQEQYRAVKGQRGAFMTIDADRLLGILAAAIGELDQAAKHLEAALATWGKGRYPEYAWTAYDYADSLLQRGALAISSELGMGPLKERILLKKRQSGTM